MKKLYFVLTLLVSLTILSACGKEPVATEPPLKKAQIKNLIVVDYPMIDQKIPRVIKVRGKARGTWFYEGSFEVRLEDANGNKITQAIATSPELWMTDDFIPFQALMTFKESPTETGQLILTGGSEGGKKLKIPVKF